MRKCPHVRPQPLFLPLVCRRPPPGDYKQSEYGKVILPFIVLRRLDCVLEGTKEKVTAAGRFWRELRKKLVRGQERPCLMFATEGK
jgi:hypothetical protein